MKKITVIGTGYVGLVTGACLAEVGNQVTCLDIDTEKIETLNSGNLPFYEPGLKELVHRVVKAKRLQFTDKYQEAIPGCDICFFALPTPLNEDESSDLSYVFLAAKQLAETMDNYLVVVNKSTVPVGTTEKIRQAIQESLEERGFTIAFDIVSNPEFLREGTAVSDSMKPDRILLGTDSTKALRAMKELYASFSESSDQILVMDIASSELAKYAANAMLASRISFMNNLAGLCEKLGANIKDVRQAIGADKRIGKNYLDPGIGFGGSCLPKDVRALRSMAKKLGHPFCMYDSILEINKRQQKIFFEKILHYFGNLEGKTLAFWGLSFKPDTDDLREAPSLYLIQKCLEHGALLRLFDPIAMPKAKLLLNHLENIHFAKDEYEAAEGTDAIVLVTEWKQFQFADFEKIGVAVHNKVLFDGRNQYCDQEMAALGFDYFSVGRKKVSEMAMT